VRVSTDELSLLRLFDGPRRLRDVLAQSHIGDLESLMALARLVDEHALRARELGLDLRLHRPRGLGVATTSSDAVLLEGCLRNLIDNALKYTPHGGVVVRLRLGAAPHPTWRVEVCDTGPGIAPELQVQVFEEFFQVGNEERDRSKGLGLGLSIVKKIVIEHGGAPDAKTAAFWLCEQIGVKPEAVGWLDADKTLETAALPKPAVQDGIIKTTDL
jgi:signal transduction histidine kinase